MCARATLLVEGDARLFLPGVDAALAEHGAAIGQTASTRSTVPVDSTETHAEVAYAAAIPAPSIAIGPDDAPAPTIAHTPRTAATHTIP